MAEQNRPFHLGGGGNAAGHHSAADTTFTKIFVGGLAWETQRETMRRYFEQFGEILEAVVITDKHTGRSKGYGFVTFKDPDAAMRACQDPSPVIDGRRANCNLASLGAAHRSRPPTPLLGAGRIWPPVAPAIASSSHHGSSVSPLSAAFFHQPAHYALPYSFYGYAGGISQDTVFPMSYYGLAGGQQHHLSPYYATTSPGLYPNFFPYYSPYSQPTQAQGGFGLPYHQMLPYPYVPPQPGSASPLFSLPTTVAPTATAGASSTSQPPGRTQEQRPTF